jgi:hypothetical protein
MSIKTFEVLERAMPRVGALIRLDVAKTREFIKRRRHRHD